MKPLELTGDFPEDYKALHRLAEQWYPVVDNGRDSILVASLKPFVMFFHENPPSEIILEPRGFWTRLKFLFTGRFPK